jgi:signal transduction histidine kinase
VSLGSLAAEKGLEFRTAVPEDLPLAYGDSKRITQCLTNLAGNALKFTRQGRVEIAVDHLDGVVRFRVSDTGTGIPSDRIEGLFAEFQQADATIAREFGGTGLGLSIAKKFVEMHGGRIWVESKLGQGSTFFFSIPLRLEAGRAA